ncbi:hypothetical protein [Mixta mediterraneensis]|nr:hypothetical protein [Mixta mediterraneensis]MBE5254566.1 hypothetical protein [Mixta mediterraneensis]
MRERPILLNGDMVRAVLNGSKAQTRRVTMAANIITGARNLGCVHHTS